MSLPEREELERIIHSFTGARVLVIGDLMWDEYIWGETSRISPEAPVPVVLVRKEERRPGGATNVLNNLVALGVQAGILGVVGTDPAGDAMEKELGSLSLHDFALARDGSRPTITKTRILARNQQLLRVDRENAVPVSHTTENEILSLAATMIPKFQAIILSDYDKGVLTPRVIESVIRIASEAGVFVAVDPQVRHFRRYAGADVMTPNEKEASEGMGEPFPESDDDTAALGDRIRSELNLKSLLITRSHRGMALFHDRKVFIPTVAREVYDVTGAGDTVIAVYASAVAAGAPPLVAALLSNIAGGVVVGKLGTATVTPEELSKHFSEEFLRFRYRENSAGATAAKAEREGQ